MAFRAWCTAACLLALLLGGCAPAAPAGGTSADASATPPEARTLRVLVRNEPQPFAAGGSGRDDLYSALFNASLSRTDAREASFPVLARSLPELNTATWRVFPDGRMETVFPLRPGLTWHDGMPLVADEFTLGHQAASQQIEWGLTNPSTENRLIEAVEAPDALTVVIRWREPYQLAGSPSLAPRPRHLLGSLLERGSAESYSNHPFWTTEYVAAGPYRLERWVQGSFIEALAFDGYALGPPRIKRVVMTWTADPNVAVSNLLAGAVDLAADFALQFTQAAELRRQWAGGGRIVLSPIQLRYVIIQFRPEYVDPPALLDVRVRRAVFHALDRASLVDVMLEGEDTTIAHSMAPTTVGYYDQIDRAITKYPYDLRRTEALLREAGFTRGADGAYRGADGPLRPPLRGLAEGMDAQETTIINDFLRRAGIETRFELMPTAVQRAGGGEVLSTFPGLRTTYATIERTFGMSKFASDDIATRENGWRGGNRTGWSDPGFDLAFAGFQTALAPQERVGYLVEMARILSEQLPALPTYFNYQVVAHVADLSGPEAYLPDSTAHANVHEWEWTR